MQKRWQTRLINLFLDKFGTSGLFLLGIEIINSNYDDNLRNLVRQHPREEIINNPAMQSEEKNSSRLVPTVLQKLL